MADVKNLNVTTRSDMAAWIPTVTSKKVYRQPKAKLYFGPKIKTAKRKRKKKKADMAWLKKLKK